MAFFFLKKSPEVNVNFISEIESKYGVSTQVFNLHKLGFRLYLFTWKSKETTHSVLMEKQNLICSIGTLIYKNKYGNEALSLIYKDYYSNCFDHTKCTGHYNILIVSDHNVVIFTELLGAWKVFESIDGSISSSFYCLLHSQKSLSFDTQGVYEYVFNGATFETRTIVNEIKRLPAGKIYKIYKNHPIKFINNTHTLISNSCSSFRRIEEIVDDYSERLDNLFNQYKLLPSTTFRSAISGGFDSRLILGCFLHTQQMPELYVYGKENDSDVKIAKSVSNAIKVNLDFIDKSKLQDNIDEDNFKLTIDRNLFMYDCCSYDGIFDAGIDYRDRFNRSKNNKILVNGSVGEVFRHFYYLRDKEISIIDFLKSYHCRFSLKIVTNTFNQNDYLERLRESIKSTLSSDSDVLTRVDVEKLYPLWRARNWSSGDMINNHKFGLSVYPFMEFNIIQGTSEVDFKKKIYGSLEAKLIMSKSPKIANCMSDYGFNFKNGPSLKYKFLSQVTNYSRPTLLRQKSYSLQIKDRSELYPFYLKEPHLKKVIDTTFPFMKRFFKEYKLLDTETFNRLCTLEYIAQKFNFSNDDVY